MGKNGGDCGGGGSSGEMGVDEMELGDEVITEYEKERLRTIEHNKAVFAALGLSELASSVADLVKDGKQVKRRQKQVAEAGGEPKRRSQRLKEKIPTSNAAMDSSSTEQSESDFSSGSPRRLKGKQKDKEYEPTDNDETESDSDESLHNSDSKEDSLHSAPVLPSNIDLDDEELALQQALALSMGTPLEFAGTGEIQNQSDWTRNKKIKVSKNIGVAERGKDLHSALPPDVSGHRQRRRKQKNQGGRSQFTEGELDALFALFDDKGRGRLSVADIAYVATAHDFAWSKDELSDMVEFFDSNQDGMLDVAEFRSLAARCNLILS